MQPSIAQCHIERQSCSTSRRGGCSTKRWTFGYVTRPVDDRSLLTFVRFGSRWDVPCSLWHTTILLSRIQLKQAAVLPWLSRVGGTSIQHTLRIARASSESESENTPSNNSLTLPIRKRLLIDSMLNVDPDGRPDIDKVGRCSFQDQLSWKNADTMEPSDVGHRAYRRCAGYAAVNSGWPNRLDKQVPGSSIRGVRSGRDRQL